ncbi:GNAT family N-acetyltransferase [Telmatocola sphagniphila]|uniref:GNAT family N-acetyltransferase n=1 Tax=Telmatocola sphagniphila TaxID=1123043 RepID=A0A8E6B4S2_9BACT|nr:GNAT family N-acetyltransferase [Telmatocola sphagniphila]QVL32130.1 GNAT family N-acetyltransferase [Telmatocola sphagniphila]
MKPSAQLLESVSLRATCEEDLPKLFELHREPQGCWMAAFINRDPEDRKAFQEHWMKVLADPLIYARTILVDSEVAGNIGSFLWDNQRQVGYWLGQRYWGRGIASRALKLFLEEFSIRPLHASAAFDNLASLRVLQKVGFQITGQEKSFARARNQEIDEIMLMLKS